MRYRSASGRHCSAWSWAVALQPLFGLLGLPALTAPFILACLLASAASASYLCLAGSPARASAGDAPERGTLAPAG
ncbi:hypothetical protein ACPA9J_06670 [Pseudomonas aeruginosa]